MESQVYIFVSDFEPGLTAITRDATGDNLPAQVKMGWRLQTGVSQTAIDNLPPVVSDRIRRYGFVLLVVEDPPEPRPTIH
jgi:hypothetical protein